MSDEPPTCVRSEPAGDGEPWMTPESYHAAAGQRVPHYNGGCQLEWHQDGWDVEIDFSAKGELTDFYIARSVGTETDG